MLNSKAKLTAFGTYVPERILTNADLEKLVDTSDEWIVQRTGMRERRIAAEDQYVSDLCIQAITRMINLYDVNINDVEMIIVATSTPDYYFPSTASRIQAHFDIPNTGSMDISAACAGFSYGLHLANGLITGGLHRKVLVVGAETLSKITDYTDRTTCILFGDGAGVALVEYDEDEGSFLTSDIGTYGHGEHIFTEWDYLIIWMERSCKTMDLLLKMDVRFINGLFALFQRESNDYWIRQICRKRILTGLYLIVLI